MTVPTDISLADYFQIQNLAYDWADTYDRKDWARLKTILGPSIRLDFRALKGELQEGLTPEQFAAIISDKKVIGDPLVKTQHLLGGAKWTSPGDGTVQASWQLRVAHVRFAAGDMAVEVNHGHGVGINQHTYGKVDGVWKIVGIAAEVLWVEGDLFGTINPLEKA